MSSHPPVLSRNDLSREIRQLPRRGALERPKPLEAITRKSQLVSPAQRRTGIHSYTRTVPTLPQLSSLSRRAPRLVEEFLSHPRFRGPDRSLKPT